MAGDDDFRGMSMRQSKRWLAGIFVLLALSACTWVKISPEMRKVRVVSAEEITDCERLGVTTVATVASFGLFDRYSKTVKEELCALARGSAVELGGNTIVPLTEVVDGRRTYAIYRCPLDGSH
jgi:hypothetical protein